MNLNEQATQPSEPEYRTCLVCGGPLPKRKPSQAGKYCGRRCFTLRNKQPNPEPTEQEVRDGIRRVALSQGQFAIVDVCDYDALSQWPWFAWWSATTRSFYAGRMGRPDENGKRLIIRMARVVANVDDPLIEVDHEDHDTLNNRRTNLRKATHAQNTRNARKHPGNQSSEHKGIYHNARYKKWQASIQVDGDFRYLGWFDTEQEAVECRNKAALELHGEFAHIPGATVYNHTKE